MSSTLENRRRLTVSPSPEPRSAIAPPVSGRPADLEPGHSLISIDGGDLWTQAEAFVYSMYLEIGYTEPSKRHCVEELARWAETSRFHAVIDDQNRIVGTIRTIFGEFEGLPVAQFERTDHGDPNPVCEFSSLVVDARMRSTGVIEHLYRAAWLDAWRHGSETVVALIDDWLLDAFQNCYHLPFRTIGVGKPFMGTRPVPVAMPLRGGAYEPLAERNPDFWEWTLEAVRPEEFRDWNLPLVILDDRSTPAVLSNPQVTAQPDRQQPSVGS